MVAVKQTAAHSELLAKSMVVQGRKYPPEFYRMPKSGGDPYFSLSRSFYYGAEKAGKLKLVRLRQRGKQRGIVLIPYDAVKKLIEEARA